MNKKLFFALVIGLLYSSRVLSDGHGHEHGHHRGHGHHHHHDHYVEVEHVYYHEPVVSYAPVAAPRYRSYDQRSPQGLVGGALGSMAGYEISRGDPLGAGLGAAAGAWIGNGMAR